MATVKVILENGEVEDEVREDLAKALSPTAEDSGKFRDDLLNQIENKLDLEFNSNIQFMIYEIMMELNRVE